MLTVSSESIACHLCVISITFPTNASPRALQSIILSLPVPPATPLPPPQWLDGMFVDSSTASEQLCLALSLSYISQSWSLSDRCLNFHMVTFPLERCFWWFHQPVGLEGELCNHGCTLLFFPRLTPIIRPSLGLHVKVTQLPPAYENAPLYTVV